QITLGGGGNNLTWTAPRAINDGYWHQVVITFDGTQTVTAYLDGQSLGALTQSMQTCQGYSPTACILEVGGPSAYTGAVDEVAIYPTALTAAKIANHFAAAGYSVPPAPTGVSVVAAPGGARVSWPASTGVVTGYLVTPTAGGTARPAVTVDPRLTSVVVPSLTAGTGYTFQVAAISPYGNSAQ